MKKFILAFYVKLNKIKKDLRMKTMDEEGKSCDHLKPDTTNHGKLKGVK